MILQHNFESAGKQKQLGKIRTAYDYWLSYIGPSKLFKDCAKAAVKNGTRMFAKLQVGNSHEVASIPFVPVPGNLYEKYKTMHKLGVSGAMQCWFFGSYPSIMTKAAGELSFSPFPKSEDEFLLKLAKRDWGKHADKIVNAWKYFKKGYLNYPIQNIFGYYSPMHNGPVWPLYLKPQDLQLAPNWLIGYPPSGDRIGECITYSHTFEEVLTLCTAMSENWNKGVGILKKLLPFYKNNPERIKDIGVAAAIGLQFRSGLNILNFYYLREKMFSRNCKNKAALLSKMKNIVKEELKIDEELLPLSKADSRLGFNSEAEGYKYFPASIKWRMNELEHLLANDFPEVEKLIKQKHSLFPEYTGEKPEGEIYRCKRFLKNPDMNGKPFGKAWDKLEEKELLFEKLHYAGEYSAVKKDRYKKRPTVWKAGYTSDCLYFGFDCKEPDMSNLQVKGTDKNIRNQYINDCIELRIEPKRLWSCQSFIVNSEGARHHVQPGKESDYQWETSVCKYKDGWSVIIKIPFKSLGINIIKDQPFRINIIRIIPQPHLEKGEIFQMWILPSLPTSKTYLAMPSSMGLGWLFFD